MDPRAARERQDAVSKGLRAQALSAFRELHRGFQDADRIADQRLLRGHEAQIHAGLVSALMRMVFVLFAEGHGLLPSGSDTHASPYALTRLHVELQEDAKRHGQAMDERHGAWARVVALFRLLHDGQRADGGPLLPPGRGRFFDPDGYPFLEGRPPGSRGPLAGPVDLPCVSDGTVLRVLDRLLVLDGERLSYGELDVEHIGAVYEGLTEERRRFGAHYTSRAMTRIVVLRTLEPLLCDATSPDGILALRICDPAMGSGAFLVETCRQLAGHLVRAWERTASTPALPAGVDPVLHARRLVARRCLYGVDRNRLAVDLARLSLWLVASARERAFHDGASPQTPPRAPTFVDHALRHGDALVGLGRDQIAGATLDAGRGSTTTTRAAVLEKVAEAEAHRRAILDQEDPADTASLHRALDLADDALRDVRAAGDLLLATSFSTQDKRAQARAMASAPDLVERVLRGAAGPEVERALAALHDRHVPFHWEIELPEVLGEGRGFDAIVGNPPWISYAGRAAQPLADDLRDFFATTSPAFRGYKNLQGLFVHRAAAMLRPGGRLGLVLPTSMSDLAGYEPSRRAHDELCVCDDNLPDFGDRAFDGVFQPSMALLSTRRPAPVPLEEAGPWPLQRKDLDEETIALLDALAALPRLPPHLFGERGFQTMGADVSRLAPLPGPEGACSTGVRVGGDVEPFLRRPPELYCDPRAFGGRFRPEADWRAVKLLIRQTARYPMAALSDGQAFRNSILAGFSDADHGEHLLLAWLNSAPLRWFHYMRHRDARQGMPQLKIGHLRALPAPPRGSPAVEELARLGRALSERNAGVSAAEQGEIDGLVAEALELDPAARSRIAAWASAVRG